MLFTPCLSSPMPSRKHRLDSKDAALANGPLKGSTRLQEVLRPVSPVFLSLSACVLLLAIVVRWGAHSPYLLFNVGSLEETGHYEGSAVYDSVYRGMHPFLKCTWSRNLCRLYVRVESCPVRPEEWVSDRSIAEQVRYMDKHGPNAFHLRVVGGWDIQALSVVDFAVSRVANDDGCLYTSRSIDLRTPGEVTFELWHMYSNFTGWKILNPGSLFNPSETMQYPARTFSGFETQQVWTLLNDIYMVPSMFSVRLRSSFLSPKFDAQRRNAFRVVSDSERLSSASRKALCSIEDIHPGAWMSEPANASDPADATRPDSLSSASFERMRRFGGPTEDIFDDCIRSMRFVPKSCDIARYSNELTRNLLYHGGVGPLVRETYIGSNPRKIIFIGDSHMRLIRNGWMFRLSSPKSEHWKQFHFPDVKAWDTRVEKAGKEIELVYCEMTSPSMVVVSDCLSSLQVGPDDVLMVGSATWPLQIYERADDGRGGETYWTRPILTIDQYRAGIVGIRDIMDGFSAGAAERKAFWISSVAFAMVDSGFLAGSGNHINDGLYGVLNKIAKDELVGTSAIGYIDLFSLTLPVNNAPRDGSHYLSFVLKELVNAQITDLLS